MMAITTETPSPADITAQPPAERLAVYGGPRAVQARYWERWRAVRAIDLLKIAGYAARGISTRMRPAVAFEKRFAELTDTRFALAMNSGTATLHSAYFAVGVKPGDEVIVPSYTFFATATPILQCGAQPVFCDVDPQTLLADPDDIARRITPRTRAICAVHLWGNPARLDRLVEIARQHKVALIEDCSHAHGAAFQGRPVGSWGDVGCFSLQGEKPVSGGEAGIAVTNDPVLFDRMLALGHYPRPGKEQQAGTFQIGELSLGLKYRPHLYAMVLADGALRRLPELNRLRGRNYQLLVDALDGFPAVSPVGTYAESQRGGYLEFLLHYDPQHAGGWSRETFAHAARAEGVPIRADRYKPLHLEPLFTTADLSDCGGYVGLGAKSSADSRPAQLPVSEQVCAQTLSMPPLTKVSERFVRQCAAALKKVAHAAQVIRDYRSGC